MNRAGCGLAHNQWNQSYQGEYRLINNEGLNLNKKEKKEKRRRKRKQRRKKIRMALIWRLRKRCVVLVMADVEHSTHRLIIYICRLRVVHVDLTLRIILIWYNSVINKHIICGFELVIVEFNKVSINTYTSLHKSEHLGKLIATAIVTSRLTCLESQFRLLKTKDQ